MKFPVVLLGCEGFYNPDNANGKTNQSLVKIKIPTFPSKFCGSLFDIRYSLFSGGVPRSWTKSDNEEARVKSEELTTKWEELDEEG